MKLKLVGMLAASFLTILATLNTPTAISVSSGSAIEVSGIKVDSTNFPDEIFREYVSTNFDNEGGFPNGILSAAEIAAVTKIDVAKTDVADLTGLEYFTKLTSLKCNNTKITSLDISKNTALYYLDCGYTSITSLDVSNNTALHQLDCYYTSITSLDISNNTKLSILKCQGNALTALDISNNTLLKTLMCFNTKIESLDISKHIALEYLNCYNTNITDLNISNNTLLYFLKCYNTAITSLDISNNVLLETLYCHNTNIDNLDISKHTALKDVKLDIGTVHCSYTYDLSNIIGFDPSKASDWNGAAYSDGKLTGNTNSNVEITCSYDLGNNGATKFTFYGNYISKHTYVDSVCIGCGKSAISPVEISGNYALIQLDYNNDTSNTHLLTYEISDKDGNIAGILELRHGTDTITQLWITQNGIEKTVSYMHLSIKNNALRINLSSWQNYFSDETYYSQLINDSILTEKLDTPVDFIWNTSKKPGYLTWNAVDGASFYCGELTYEGKYVCNFHQFSLGNDLSSVISESGTYISKVKAIGGKYTADSDYCEAVAYEYIRPEEEIGAPTKVWWSTKEGASEPTIINWTPVAGAVGYQLLVKDSKTGSTSGCQLFNSNNEFVTSYDCTNLMKTLEDRNGKISTFICEVIALPGNIEVVANTPGNSASSDKFISIEKLEEEIKNKLEDTTADTVIKDIEDTGIDKMADAMQNNQEIRDKIADIEKDYTKNNNINILPPESNHPEFKKDDIKIVGAGFNAKPDSEIKLDFIELDKKDEKPVNEKLYKNPVQVDIKLKDKDENVSGTLKTPITITMKAPSNLNLAKLVILHHLENGNIEQISPIINEDGTITFSVTSFSTFVFADLVYYDQSGSETLPDDDTPSLDSDSDEDYDYYIDANEEHRSFIKTYYWNGKEGWKKVSNDWYYFDKDGTVKTGWIQTADEKWYYMNQNGKMATGWIQSPESKLWYYMDTANGDLLSNSWLCDPQSGRWYYLDANGAMCTGWIMINDTWYLLDKNGAMCTGWNLVNNNWYYMNQSGSMLSGWQTIGVKEYFLDETGKCLINAITPDGHEVDETGAKIK